PAAHAQRAHLHPFPTRRSSDLVPNDVLLDDTGRLLVITGPNSGGKTAYCKTVAQIQLLGQIGCYIPATAARLVPAEHIFYQVPRSEEHTSELQSRENLVCRLLL